VDDGEEGEGFTNFVTLEVADEMPLEVFREEVDLLHGFLLARFSKLS